MECFDKGMSFSTVLQEKVQIPFDGVKLEGRFFQATAAPKGARPPCVIFLSGADALPEENYFRGVQQVTARGMSCLVLNGPGKGSTLRLLKRPAIPDYERPVAAAIDYLETRKDVDHDRIGRLGVSFGSYYGMRAVTAEPRIKACVIWGALYDVLNDIYRYYPPLREQLNWIGGAKDDEDAERIYAPFTLEGRLGNVRCPVLITHGENDRMVPASSAQRTFDELKVADKTLRFFDREEGGRNIAASTIGCRSFRTRRIGCQTGW
jgi:dipeptidyl aminopeptidase/acylaminoacyl peptidase